jgi:type II secretory pathway pseudopilin PulG
MFRGGRDAGVTLIELLLVMALALTLTAIVVPLTANEMDAVRASHAASFLAARFQLARTQAVSRTASVAVAFDLTPGGWTIRSCIDGNGNGVRRAEMRSGRDVCFDGPYDIDALFPGIVVGVDPTLRGPDGEAGSADPVRFGASNMASFSPAGSCTAGTVYLRSAKGVQYAVRVSGVLGRLRLLRYDPASRQWTTVG